MSKRATLTFTNEDPSAYDADQIRIYYCLYSGKPAFVTDCDIEALPKRKTDNATLIDTERHLLKLYTTDGGVKLIRRRNGNVERQYRLNIDILPVAYRSEPEGRFVYVMERAVTAFESGDSGSAPIPPCISAFDKDGCQIGLEVEDQSTRSVLLKVGVDIVRISIMNSVSHEQANNEILKLFGKILTCRSSQMTVMKGHSTRHKILLIQNLSPQEAYTKLRSVKTVEKIESIQPDASP